MRIYRNKGGVVLGKFWEEWFLGCTTDDWVGRIRAEEKGEEKL